MTIHEKGFIRSWEAGVPSLLAWDPVNISALGKRYTLRVSNVREWKEKVASSLPIASKVGRPNSMNTAKFQATLYCDELPKMPSCLLAETVALLNE